MLCTNPQTSVSRHNRGMEEHRHQSRPSDAYIHQPRALVLLAKSTAWLLSVEDRALSDPGALDRDNTNKAGETSRNGRDTARQGSFYLSVTIAAESADGRSQASTTPYNPSNSRSQALRRIRRNINCREIIVDTAIVVYRM